MEFTINKWKIFNSLEQKFISNIYLAFTNGQSALIVTKDDDVYAFGENNDLYLGVDSNDQPIQLQKVEPLCKKGIIALSSGGYHMVALTKSGQVLTWGYNANGEIGDGTTTSPRPPYLVPSNLLGKRVVDISCGYRHTLILNEYGEIYGWGYNGSNNNVSTPQKVNIGNISQKVKSIACGLYFSLAVLDNGEVYEMGDMINGSSRFNNPRSVSFSEGVSIQKVACGSYYALALSNDGSLYTWGANSSGQLGTGNTNSQTTPQKIAQNLGRFEEIGASHFSDTSAALTQDKKCYVWGKCSGQSFLFPTIIQYQSIHDAFAFFSEPSITWKPVVLMEMNSSASKGSLLDLISRSFDDPKISDFKFIIQDHEIYVHKFILRIRCEHFNTMFKSDWEGAKDSLTITQYSYPVFYALLKYIYTNEVDLPLEHAMELLDLANSYCEYDLKHECERLIRNEINVDNVAMIYAHAIKFEAKDLEEYCFRSIVNQFTAVVQTEEFSKLDAGVIKNLLLKAADDGSAFKT